MLCLGYKTVIPYRLGQYGFIGPRRYEITITYITVILYLLGAQLLRLATVIIYIIILLICDSILIINRAPYENRMIFQACSSNLDNAAVHYTSRQMA